MDRKETLLVVGSGITGLMSAFKAIEAGFDVTIVSKSPDPRKFSEDTTLFQSSTHDGSFNRYITSTEGHPYLDLEGYITKMYRDISPDFEKTIQEGGMLALEQGAFEKETKNFLSNRSKINKNIRENRSVEEKYENLFEDYIAENLMSMNWWYEDLTSFLDTNPELARELSLSLGIHRLYDTEKLFKGACHSLSKHGILKKVYSLEEALNEKEFTAYHEGMRKGTFVKGGALIMYGLAFNIKAVVRFLLDSLESRGVKFYFGDDCGVVNIKRDDNDNVSGLETKSGEIFTARYVLFHGGAYTDPKLFKGTKAEAQVGGMKGFWINIKGELAEKIIGGMGKPPKANKIHGGKIMINVDGKEYLSQVADLNIMPVTLTNEGREEKILCIGSGYLFVGEYPFKGDLDIEPEKSTQNKEAIERGEKLAKAAFFEVVKRVYDLDINFEDAYQVKHDDVDVVKKGCVRSWSVDDKELRVIEKTSDGGVMIIHGGGNTGDTTKSEFISRTAIKFLEDCSPTDMTNEQLEERYEKTRKELREERKKLTFDIWQGLEENLNKNWKKARQSL